MEVIFRWVQNCHHEPGFLSVYFQDQLLQSYAQKGIKAVLLWTVLMDNLLY